MIWSQTLLDFFWCKALWTYIFSIAYLYKYICRNMHIYVNMHICISHICIYIYTYMCIYIHIYIYIMGLSIYIYTIYVCIVLLYLFRHLIYCSNLIYMCIYHIYNIDIIAIIYNHTHPIPNLNPESRTFAMQEQRGYLRTCKYFASSFGRLGRIQERYQEVVLSSKSHPKPCTEAPVHTSCREVRLD